MLEELDGWMAAARAKEAADARARERWLRQAAEEGATMAGVLVDVAEDQAEVVVTTTGGRRHRGTVAAVGVDFVAIAGEAGRLVLVALRAMAEVRAPSPRSRPAASSSRRPPAAVGAGGPGLGVDLVEVLAQAAGSRPRVSVTAGEATVVGELRAVGEDVLTVRADGEPPATSYVTLASVSEVSLFDSG